MDKYLSEANMGSRSQIREWARKGRLRVNGRPCLDPSTHIRPGEDSILCGGEPVSWMQAPGGYMLHKPAGYVSARKDREHPAVFDLLPPKLPASYSIAGRLDKDSTGLLLILNHGVLIHRLLSPKYHVWKTYEAKTGQDWTLEQLQALEAGVDIGEEKPTLPARTREIRRGLLELSIREGQFHQVKRMLRSVGQECLGLHRRAYGPLVLDEDLEPGAYRCLRTEELAALMEAVGLGEE